MASVMAGETVLAPNTELAAALFDAVERTHRHAGRDLWPTPRVRDFSSWLKDQHALRQLEDAVSLRVLSDIEERELWRSVIESSESGRDFPEPAGAARAARRARRALYEFGIPLRAIAAEPSLETRLFVEWNQEFETRCRSLSCRSADSLLATTPPCTGLAWMESSAWRPVARQWLMAHARMLAPPASRAETVAEWCAPTPEAELAAIAHWALENLRRTEGFRAWVCVPDLRLRRDEVVDAFDAALAPQRFSLSDERAAPPYAVAGGTPLAGHAAVAAALETLAASIDEVRFEAFSALLRAPQLQASPAEAGAAALLDVQLRRRANAQADLATWLGLSERIAQAQSLGEVAAVRRLRAAHLALEEIRGNHPMSRWVEVWVRALESGPWGLRQHWSSGEYQSAERFRELLATLAAADGFFGALSRRSAQRILARAARDTAFQAQTGIPAVWVSGQLHDPWLNYHGVWISGMSDRRWPPPVDPLPLLPAGLQRQYGVIGASAESQMQFALDLQQRWRARGAQCVFSHAGEDDGSAAAPSPLLPPDAAPLELDPPPARPHWLAQFEAAPELEQWLDEQAPPFAAGERTRGVATLKAQSRCAFRGFAESRLMSERLERPVPGFNDRERGNLIHDALEQIWDELRDSRGLESMSTAALTGMLRDAAARALAKACRVRDPGPKWRGREHARMVGVLCKWLDLERLREPFEVEHLEQGAQVAHHAGLDFNVRIDRVDRLADGARVLIDYKTGRAGADWRGERPDNPQLPIYALLRPESLVAVAYGRVNAGECSFIAESERRGIFTPRGQKSKLEGMRSLAALIEIWSRRIENIAADFAAGRAPVAPTVQACRSCHLQGLCRVPAALGEAAP